MSTLLSGVFLIVLGFLLVFLQVILDRRRKRLLPPYKYDPDRVRRELMRMGFPMFGYLARPIGFIGFGCVLLGFTLLFLALYG